MKRSVVILVVFLMFKSVNSYAQDKVIYIHADTLFFNKNDTPLTELQKIKLDTISKSMKPFSSFTLYSGGKTQKQKQSAYGHCYLVYEYLIRKHHINPQTLHFKSDLQCIPGLVIIRPAAAEELSGTNCGIPLMPRIK